MYEYGLDIVTNDYQFLFCFALETNALIEPKEFEDFCSSFTFRYADETEANHAESLLSSILQNR